MNNYYGLKLSKLLWYARIFFQNSIIKSHHFKDSITMIASVDRIIQLADTRTEQSVEQSGSVVGSI